MKKLLHKIKTRGRGKHGPSKPAKQQETIEPLPFLPERPSGGDNPAPSSTEGLSYGLFCGLPFEVRRIILTHAFGERTLHVDLSHRHPLLRRNDRPVGSSQQEIVTSHCGIGTELVEDTSEPKRWQWFSCVCHRLAEVEDPSTVAYYKFNSTLWPWEDGCLQGRRCYCQHRTLAQANTDPCSVGAMGWLLSCKSAYAEGVRVLYTTNTFYISSLPLLLNAGRLLLQRDLNTIEKLQIALGTHDLPRTAKDPLIDGLWDSSPGRKDCTLIELCREIPAIFPNLRQLDVYLQSWLVPPKHVPVEEALDAMEGDVLGPLHDMMCHFASTAQLSVAISVEAWKALAQKYHQLDPEGLRYEQYDYDSGRFWMPLSAEAEARQFGYWMYAGWNDTAWVNDPNIQSCFGQVSHVADVWGYYKRETELGAVAFPQ